MNTLPGCMLLLLSCALPPAAFAQPGGDEMPASPGGGGAYLAKIEERLRLTPEQTAQVRPILQEQAARLRELRAKYSNQDSRRSRRKMLREAKGIREETDRKLAKLLSKEQMAELKKLRKEQRERLREARAGVQLEPMP